MVLRLFFKRFQNSFSLKNIQKRQQKAFKEIIMEISKLILKVISNKLE